MISVFSVEAQNWLAYDNNVRFYKIVYLMKQDTIDAYTVYGNVKRIDSVKKWYSTYTKILNKKNIWESADSLSYLEAKLIKKRPSKWFKKFNPIYFNAEAEYKFKYRKEYIHDRNEIVIVRSYSFLTTRRIIKPKK